jgi:hypothetical protein
MQIQSDANQETTQEVRAMLDQPGLSAVGYLEEKFSLLILQNSPRRFEVFQLMREGV